jgi:photosystem II stability/assembly factor-like uncharacterized protein
MNLTSDHHISRATRLRQFAHSKLSAAVALAILAFSATPLFAQQNAQPAARQSAPVIDPNLYSAMRWRMIGPHRGGRVSAVAGIPGDPAVYYMGTPGGGVWKTTDSGSVWTPIFDRERVASIGAVAIAPSNSNIIYVGTGEQTDGNGMYKSTDAGATWTHVGLDATHYISSVIIDPRNPDIVVVGALGHPILGVAANKAERGVFKSLDGGKSWTRTLFKDEKAGVSDMVADPGNPRVLYAALWHPRDFFGDASEKQDSWIYKSIDEGSTWNPVGSAGLPTEPLDRVGVAVAPGDRGRRVFAISARGLYRSDDAGSTWRKITTDARITGNGYICHVYVDPRNADTVYVMQTTTYRSLDGGKTFAAFKGAPGGDDYHVLWIDPQNSQRMILGVDQGATISLNGGQTWSDWFNQPTGQFYHVITDNQFPYIAYAPQQDSGTAAVPSRSDYGVITYRDWFSIGGFEFCYIAPDPTNPNIVYSGGWYGSVVRFDKITGQIAHVFVRGTSQRTSQMPPLVFSPQDSRTLYFGTQNVLKSTDSGQSWQMLSPDLATKPEPPADPAKAAALVSDDADREAEEARERARDAESAAGNKYDPDSFAYEMDDNDKDSDAEQGPRGGGALTVLAPSTISAGVIWAGTTNGIIQLTQDSGLSWQKVSPPDPSGFISTIEPSHYDPNVAYATVNAMADLTPLAYRTRDAGKSWQKITAGFEPGWIVRVVREDPVRKGLLYAGTENAAYVSFDDGEHWQSLQLNLPTATIRDLVVHDNDLVIATYGRALWVLDDISPLRQIGAQSANASADLLRPSTAIRTRWDNDQETPLPPEFPGADNPPNGAMIYYYLKSPPADPVAIEIRDAQGNLVRRFTSEKPAPDNVLKNVPDYWFGPLTQLSTNAGLNRFVWNLRYDSPPALQYSYYGNTLDYLEYTISADAIPGHTPREQTVGPLAVPGDYKVVFIAGGQKFTQPLTIALDPRVHVSRSDLVQQFDLAQRISAGLKSSYTVYNAAAPLRAAIADRMKILTVATKEKPETPKAAKTVGAPNTAEGGKAAVTTTGAATETHEAAPPDSEALAAMKQFAGKFDTIINGTRSAPGIGPINRDLARIDFMIETGDAAPADAAQIAVHDSCTSLTSNIAQWQDLNAKTLPTVNAILDKQKIAPLPAAAPTMADPPGVPLDACAP